MLSNRGKDQIMGTRVLRRADREQAKCDDWNGRCPIGTPVRYWLGAMREGEGVESTTSTIASVLSGHTAMVFVVRGRGHTMVALTHVEPVEVQP
jgi:hypothetical protein